MRSLVMIAKCLQNLANLVEFGGKETYMEVVNPFILKNKERMVVFLDHLSVSRSCILKIFDLKRAYSVRCRKHTYPRIVLRVPARAHTQTHIHKNTHIQSNIHYKSIFFL